MWVVNEGRIGVYKSADLSRSFPTLPFYKKEIVQHLAKNWAITRAVNLMDRRSIVGTSYARGWRCGIFPHKSYGSAGVVARILFGRKPRPNRHQWEVPIFRAKAAIFFLFTSVPGKFYRWSFHHQITNYNPLSTTIAPSLSDGLPPPRVHTYHIFHGAYFDHDPRNFFQ